MHGRKLKLRIIRFKFAPLMCASRSRMRNWKNSRRRRDAREKIEAAHYQIQICSPDVCITKPDAELEKQQEA